jgi:hypothetical protein
MTRNGSRCCAWLIAERERPPFISRTVADRHVDCDTRSIADIQARFAHIVLLAFTACALAVLPIRGTHFEGFSYFAAPVASGWSGCRVGLAPLESAASSRGTPNADIPIFAEAN